jgi:hypothetical protein
MSILDGPLSYVATIINNSSWQIQQTPASAPWQLGFTEPISQQRLGLFGLVTSNGNRQILSTRACMSSQYLTIESSAPINSQSISYRNQVLPIVAPSTVAASGGSVVFVHQCQNANPVDPNTGYSESYHGERVSTQNKLFGSSSDWTGVDRFDVTIRDDLGQLADTSPQRWNLNLVFYDGLNLI